MKYTTLNEIREHGPCKTSWHELLFCLDKTKADDRTISFEYLLETLGLDDAVWCLRVMPYREECLFRADLSELVLPLFEKARPDDDRPRKAIAAVRAYHAGKIGGEQLRSAAAAAAVAAAYAAAAAAAAAAYAAAVAAAAAAAYAAAAYDAYDAAAYDAVAADDAVKELFIKHFCVAEK